MSTQVSFQQLPVLTEQLLAAGRHRDAIKLVRAFMDKGAIHFPAIRAVIMAAIAAGDISEASMLQDILKARAPEKSEVWVLACQAAAQQHQWQQVIDSVAQARARKVRMPLLDLLEASAYEHLQQPDEALRVLDACKPVTPAEKSHWHYIWAGAQTGKKNFTDIAERLPRFLARADDNVHTAGCWKHLGKARDRLEDWEGAFDAMTRGNRLQQKLYGQPITTNPLGLRLRALHELYTPEWVAKLPTVATARRAPVFLIGFPRSGTTLLDQILDAHPAIQTLEEKRTVEHVWDVLAPALAIPGAPPVNRNDPAALAQRYREELARIALLNDAQLDTLRDAYEAAVARYTNWQAGQVLVDKMPLNTVSIGLLLRLYPQARFIVSLRHPCDVLLSNYMQDFDMNPGMQYMTSLEWSSGLYADMMALLWQYRDVLGIDSQIHTVRYENLVADMPGEARKVLDFLGLPWDDAVLGYAEHARGRGTLATPSRQGVTEGIYTRAVNRWHHYAGHFEPLIERLRPACERYGYSLLLPDNE
jgi:hypothetical protein